MAWNSNHDSMNGIPHMTMTRKAALASAVSLFLLLAAACSSTSKEKKLGAAAGSLKPDQAIASLKFAEDFHAELFAAEPNVVDPVDIVFDEKGRAYVAE